MEDKLMKSGLSFLGYAPENAKKFWTDSTPRFLQRKHLPQPPALICRSSVAQLSTSLAGQSARPVCSLRGLSPGQARICDLFKDHMPAVGQGAQTAIQECQYQFKSNRWNCSTPYGSGIVGPIHKLGTREAAFTYAILSAGVTHEIGRRCKQGLLASCGCSEEAKPKNVADDWTWGGCGDNVDYGYRFAK
ncbi:unnamed protein product [Cylicostephanus goldi]|uniref:Protein Wnt n=1 Tax=Cylicostephanus goldi TaxID=71465 RepID=A0A3P6TBG4_CYLGO|nr:unnamed protein product [Cylicostephanus goldi]